LGALPSTTVLCLPQVLEKRPASRDRQQQDLPENLASSLFPRPLLVCSRLPLEYKHCRIFHKIHAALIALPTVILGMLAGRANKAGRCVASRAELICVWIFMAAFGAFHGRPPLFSVLSIGEGAQELQLSIGPLNLHGNTEV
jgi:hypothetical protein